MNFNESLNKHEIINSDMKEPDIVPDKITNPINPLIIFGILSLGVGIFISMNVVSEEDSGTIAFSFSVLLTIIITIFALIVAKQNEIGILSKSYFALGLGFLSYAIGELLYYSMEDLFGIEPYPSIADVFFLATYPLLLIHLILNIRNFNVGYTKIQKIWLPAIPIFALIAYVILSIGVPDAELNFDFYYGLIFVAASSTTLSFSILGALTFRQGALGVVWLLLVVGLMINASGDVWYYHLEIFGQYYDAHPLTSIWYVANSVYHLCPIQTCENPLVD